MDVKEFQELVKAGRLAEVKAAVAEDPSLATTLNSTGQSSFTIAKYYRQEETAEYLLSVLPRLDLFEASVAGRTDAVLQKIENDPALLESRNSDGWTPLHLAAFFGHPELLKKLIDKGALVNARSGNSMQNTPLHAAVAGGKAEIVRLLAERGADVNAQQHGGWTALHGAAQSGNREMVEVLVAHGADLKARAVNNQSALDLALQKGHEPVAALLEQLGAQLG